MQAIKLSWIRYFSFICKNRMRLWLLLTQGIAWSFLDKI